jgi:hypothetical protein
MAGIQHIQRGSYDRPLTLFEAIYFIIVTLSTVGYGDISPDIWPGQAFIFVMIMVSFAFVPKQVREKPGEINSHHFTIFCLYSQCRSPLFPNR